MQVNVGGNIFELPPDEDDWDEQDWQVWNAAMEANNEIIAVRPWRFHNARSRSGRAVWPNLIPQLNTRRVEWENMIEDRMLIKASNIWWDLMENNQGFRRDWRQNMWGYNQMQNPVIRRLAGRCLSEAFRTYRWDVHTNQLVRVNDGQSYSFLWSRYGYMLVQLIRMCIGHMAHFAN